MNYFIALPLIAALLIPIKQPVGKIEKNGMHVSWHFSKTKVHFKIKSPEKGWVAIDFNDKDQLKGTHLLMAYATHDDFGHHSIMRTTQFIKL